MPSPLDYLRRKKNVPSELSTQYWDTVSVWLRERAFFMACVDRAETLQKFRNTIEAVTSGGIGASEARQRMREFLAESGYQAPHGQEGTIKDLSSTQRLKRSIDTNVAMANGWATRQEHLGDILHPAQKLYRFMPARQPRDWETRWENAAKSVNWEGVARNGEMIALTTSPIWKALSRFGQPYPPFDFGSHMSVQLVSLEECININLVEDPKALREEMEAARSSFNEGVEVDASGWSKDICEEIAKQLQGLAELKDGVLRMLDPNGTTVYPPEKLAEVLSDPLPAGIPNLEFQALKDWIEDSSRFDPWTKEEIKIAKKEALSRVINRSECFKSSEFLKRGLCKGSKSELLSLVDELEKKGYYQARPGKVADSWTLSDRAADQYASNTPWQIKLICTKHTSARNLAPLYSVVKPQSSNPTKPLSTEAELLIPGNVRLYIKKIIRENLNPGMRITIYCKEED